LSEQGAAATFSLASPSTAMGQVESHVFGHLGMELKDVPFPPPPPAAERAAGAVCASAGAGCTPTPRELRAKRSSIAASSAGAPSLSPSLCRARALSVPTLPLSPLVSLSATCHTCSPLPLIYNLPPSLPPYLPPSLPPSLPPFLPPSLSLIHPRAPSW
jgi:hypothetical protein